MLACVQHPRQLSSPPPTSTMRCFMANLRGSMKSAAATTPVASPEPKAHKLQNPAGCGRAQF